MNITKLWNYILFSCVCLSLAAFGSVDTGARAPDFSLNGADGNAYSLSDFRGQYVVLEWTNHGCPFVAKFYRDGHMQGWQKEMTEKGVVWLQICSSAMGKQGYLSRDEAKELYTANGSASTAYLIDASGEVGGLYDARTTPHLFLISPDGMILYQGAIDSIRSLMSSDISKATNYLIAAYSSAVAGEPIENPTTIPYGCGVKY
ncbi:MAG TPA: thioredoxin family protein [Opitutae bacterium]|nr:thioredoxin family protein [Opitutae bacterium]